MSFISNWGRPYRPLVENASMLIRSCATPDCPKPLRRPNGTADGSQFCVTCYSRWRYHKSCTEGTQRMTPERFKGYHNARTRAWQASNPEKVKAFVARYRAAHPDAVKTWNRAANARRRKEAAHVAA